MGELPPMPYRPVKTGLHVTIKARPGLARARPPVLVELAEGKKAIEIAVHAPPEDGKANQALIEKLAALWDIRKSAITLVNGHTHRVKVLHIEGNPDQLLARMRTWIETLPTGSKTPNP